MLNCKPISAGWNPSAGSCDETGRILVLSKVISVAAIVTDWACAIIPAFMYVLGSGLTTFARHQLTLIQYLGFTNAIKAEDNTLLYLVFGCSVCVFNALFSILANILLTMHQGEYLDGYTLSISSKLREPRESTAYVLISRGILLHILTQRLYTDEFGIMCIWTMLECGLGIIAGSLPSLRPLLKKLGFTSSNKSYGVKRTGESTAGGSRGIPLSQLRTGHSSAAAQTKGGEWERIDDHSSQRNIIMKNTEIDIKWSEGSSV